MILDLEGSQEVADIRSLYRCGTGQATRDTAAASAFLRSNQTNGSVDQTCDLTKKTFVQHTLKTVK